MVINDKPRQSCSALVDQLTQPIRLAPMKTFPVVRDLQVDRTRMFDSLKKVKAWVPIDGSYELGEGPRMPERKRQWAYGRSCERWKTSNFPVAIWRSHGNYSDETNK